MRWQIRGDVGAVVLSTKAVSLSLLLLKPAFPQDIFVSQAAAKCPEAVLQCSV